MPASRFVVNGCNVCKLDWVGSPGLLPSYPCTICPTGPSPASLRGFSSHFSLQTSSKPSKTFTPLFHYLSTSIFCFFSLLMYWYRYIHFYHIDCNEHIIYLLYMSFIFILSFSSFHSCTRSKFSILVLLHWGNIWYTSTRLHYLVNRIELLTH